MPQGEQPRFGASRTAAWLAIAGLLGSILAAYHNSFSAPFVFDDTAAIGGNPTIRHLSDLANVLSPPREGGQTVGGRPVVNLSLALNYALGGVDVHGYHAFNVAVHVLAALLLFGVVRRTLLQPGLRERHGHVAIPLAAAVAGLWALHPLQTESVTYVIQRAESLMGLFYLLTLYAFIRGASGAGVQPRWLVLSFAACAVGMATKEVMATAPLIVLLYDRTFISGSGRTALAARKRFYASLAATWLLLGWLVLGAENRGGTAGLGLNDSVWTYALTQTRAIVLYLKLAVWPHPLVLDYGTSGIERIGEALPFAALVGGLLGLSIWAIVRKPRIGFLGAWFFAILAPSSSIVPIPVQPFAEHRMYLPLAAIAALAVLGLHAVWRRSAWLALAGVGVALGLLSAARNAAYGEPGSIWRDTLAKRPANARAHCFYGDALAAEGKFAEALAQYDEGLQLERGARDHGGRTIVCDLLVNSGNVLRALGRDGESIARYEEALRVEPRLIEARYNLGASYLQANRFAEAVEQLDEALRIDPNYAAAHTNRGAALLLAGRTDAAIAAYETALRLEPSGKARQDLGIALLYARRLPEAVARLQEAVRLDPDLPKAHEFLGNALLAQGRKAEAAEHYRRALQLQPLNARARRALEALSASRP